MMSQIAIDLPDEVLQHVSNPLANSPSTYFLLKPKLEAHKT